MTTLVVFLWGVVLGLLIAVANKEYLEWRQRRRLKKIAATFSEMILKWQDRRVVKKTDMEWDDKAYTSPLHVELQAAILREDYEEAARLRDLINKK